jgi:hypothetical protein
MQRAGKRLVLLLLAALVAGGCAGPPAQPTTSGTYKLPTRYRVLATPKDLRDDYVYPPSQTRHVLRWEEDDLDWSISFPGSGYAYAGLVLRRPLDMQSTWNQTELALNIQPASMAPFLSVALIDGSTNRSRVMLECPLSPEPADGRQGVAAKPAPGQKPQVIRLPLSLFGTSGIGLDDGGRAPLEFDWSCVREIRIIAYGDRPGRSVSIQYLRFEK